jgi:hypothetical protein
LSGPAGENSASFTIEKMDTGRHEVDLKVQYGSGQPENWSIRQVWDDTGSNYELVFNHGGEKEPLPRKAKS